MGSNVQMATYNDLNTSGSQAAAEEDKKETHLRLGFSWCGNLQSNITLRSPTFLSLINAVHQRGRTSFIRATAAVLQLLKR